MTNDIIDVGIARTKASTLETCATNLSKANSAMSNISTIIGIGCDLEQAEVLESDIAQITQSLASAITKINSIATKIVPIANKINEERRLEAERKARLEQEGAGN